MFDLTTLVPTLLTIAVTVLLAVVPVYVGIMSRLSTMEAKFDALNANVEKHNRFAERLPVVEQQVADLRRDTDEIYERLRKVETGGKNE